MKLAFVRSLDVGDPLPLLGSKASPPRVQARHIFAVEIRPGIFLLPDGRLETRSEFNATAPRDFILRRRQP